MTLYADALREHGRFLAGRRAARPRRESGGSAKRLAATGRRDALLRRRRLLEARPDRAERPCARRRRRVPRPRPAHDLRGQPRAARAEGRGGATTRPGGSHRRGRAAAAGRGGREIRACAVHARASCSPRGSASRPAPLDVALWTKGQAPKYKSVPRHRTRTVFWPPALSRTARGGFEGAPRRGLAAGLLRDELLELVEPVARPLIASATGSGRWTQSASGPRASCPPRARGGRGSPPPSRRAARRGSPRCWRRSSSARRSRSGRAARCRRRSSPRRRPSGGASRARSRCRRASRPGRSSRRRPPRRSRR